jgi:hypothetical protein
MAISLWPDIRFLTIGARIATLPPIKLPAIKLYELAPSNTLIPSVSLDWLLSNSEDSLQIFELRDVPGRQMKDILTKTGHNLGSLRLERYFKFPADKLWPCTRLEELAIYPPSSSRVFHLRPNLLPYTILETMHFVFYLTPCQIHEWLRWMQSHDILPRISESVTRVGIVRCSPSNPCIFGLSTIGYSIQETQ